MNTNCGVFLKKTAVYDEQMKWYEKAKRLMKQKGITQPDLINALGVSTRGAIGHYLNGRREPSVEQMQALADILCVSIDALMSDELDQCSAHPGKINERLIGYDAELKCWKLPVIDWVKAGDFAEVIDPYQPGYADDFVNTVTKPKPHTFALRVSGDSMEPNFYDGMIIVVEPELDPLPNDFVIVKNGGNEATFKQLIKDGADYYLKPLNPRYPIKPLGDSRIVGVVREAIIKFR